MSFQKLPFLFSSFPSPIGSAPDIYVFQHSFIIVRVGWLFRKVFVSSSHLRGRGCQRFCKRPRNSCHTQHYRSLHWCLYRHQHFCRIFHGHEIANTATIDLVFIGMVYLAKGVISFPISYPYLCIWAEKNKFRYRLFDRLFSGYHVCDIQEIIPWCTMQRFCEVVHKHAAIDVMTVMLPQSPSKLSLTTPERRYRGKHSGSFTIATIISSSMLIGSTKLRLHCVVKVSRTYFSWKLIRTYKFVDVMYMLLAITTITAKKKCTWSSSTEIIASRNCVTWKKWKLLRNLRPGCWCNVLGAEMAIHRGQWRTKSRWICK